MNSPHTPLPLKVPLRVISRSMEIVDAEGALVLNVFTIDKLTTLPALVLAANAFPALVAALKGVDKWLLVIESAVRTDAPHDYVWVKEAMDAVRAALALAEGGKER